MDFKDISVSQDMHLWAQYGLKLSAASKIRRVCLHKNVLRLGIYVQDDQKAPRGRRFNAIAGALVAAQEGNVLLSA
jgi:hypothetical protein